MARKENYMKFDRTDGNKARYVVHKYGWNVEDHYYFSDYDRARVLFNEMKNSVQKGIIISLYDLSTDERKDFVRG